MVTIPPDIAVAFKAKCRVNYRDGPLKMVAFGEEMATGVNADDPVVRMYVQLIGNMMDALIVGRVYELTITITDVRARAKTEG